MSQTTTQDSRRDLTRLFIGAFAQWFLSALFGRWVVSGSAGPVFAVTFIGQSLWWLNIQQTTRTNSRPRWFAWTLGASFGAAIGTLIPMSGGPS